MAKRIAGRFLLMAERLQYLVRVLTLFIRKSTSCFSKRFQNMARLSVSFRWARLLKHLISQNATESSAVLRAACWLLKQAKKVDRLSQPALRQKKAWKCILFLGRLIQLFQAVRISSFKPARNS